MNFVVFPELVDVVLFLYDTRSSRFCVIRGDLTVVSKYAFVRFSCMRFTAFLSCHTVVKQLTVITNTRAV